jgi:small subunit ribosomal protein S8e
MHCVLIPWSTVTSITAQVGRADGYILEGKELEFYQKLVSKKKGSKH